MGATTRDSLPRALIWLRQNKRDALTASVAVEDRLPLGTAYRALHLGGPEGGHARMICSSAWKEQRGHRACMHTRMLGCVTGPGHLSRATSEVIHVDAIGMQSWAMGHRAPGLSRRGLHPQAATIPAPLQCHPGEAPCTIWNGDAVWDRGRDLQQEHVEPPEKHRVLGRLIRLLSPHRHTLHLLQGVGGRRDEDWRGAPCT